MKLFKFSALFAALLLAFTSMTATAGNPSQETPDQNPAQQAPVAEPDTDQNVDPKQDDSGNDNADDADQASQD